MSAGTLPRPLNVAELVELLRVSPAWIYRECRAGRLPHARVAGHLRFTADHVRQILAASSEPAPVAAPVIPLRSRRLR